MSAKRSVTKIQSARELNTLSRIRIRMQRLTLVTEKAAATLIQLIPFIRIAITSTIRCNSGEKMRRNNPNVDQTDTLI